MTFMCSRNSSGKAQGSPSCRPPRYWAMVTPRRTWARPSCGSFRPGRGCTGISRCSGCLGLPVRNCRISMISCRRSGAGPKPRIKDRWPQPAQSIFTMTFLIRETPPERRPTGPNATSSPVCPQLSLAFVACAGENRRPVDEAGHHEHHQAQDGDGRQYPEFGCGEARDGSLGNPYQQGCPGDRCEYAEQHLLPAMGQPVPEQPGGGQAGGRVVQGEHETVGGNEV